MVADKAEEECYCRRRRSRAPSRPGRPWTNVRSEPLWPLAGDVGGASRSPWRAA